MLSFLVSPGQKSKRSPALRGPTVSAARRGISIGTFCAPSTTSGIPSARPPAAATRTPRPLKRDRAGSQTVLWNEGSEVQSSPAPDHMNEPIGSIVTETEIRTMPVVIIAELRVSLPALGSRKPRGGPLPAYAAAGSGGGSA